MIKAQGGDAGDYWLWHNVCTVVRAPDTDFENGGINLAERSADTRGRNLMDTDIQ